MARINPFAPNSPVAPGMFVGRLAQVDSLEQSLLPTRAGRPKGFMLTGERGIGKTSLLQYFKWLPRDTSRLEAVTTRLISWWWSWTLNHLAQMSD